MSFEAQNVFESDSWKTHVHFVQIIDERTSPARYIYNSLTYGSGLHEM